MQFPSNEKKGVQGINYFAWFEASNFYCAGDDIKESIQTPSGLFLQSEFYIGLTNGYNWNLFLLAPDGLITTCVINARIIMLAIGARHWTSWISH
jgi:hypothetical protein